MELNVTWGLIGAIAGMLLLSPPALWVLKRSQEQRMAELAAEGKGQEAGRIARSGRLVTAAVLIADAGVGFMIGALALPKLLGE